MERCVKCNKIIILKKSHIVSDGGHICDKCHRKERLEKAKNFVGTLKEKGSIEVLTRFIENHQGFCVMEELDSLEEELQDRYDISIDMNSMMDVLHYTCQTEMNS